MYNVCFISRRECFIQKDQIPGVELEPYGNTVDMTIFKSILNQSLTTPPNLLILHPPRGIEVDEVINILKEHSTKSMATIFITSTPRELDIWYKGFGRRCVQIPERLLERIWDSLIRKLIISKGAYDLFASLLECTIEHSDQIVETASTTGEEKIKIEDDPHNTRNIYGPREVLKLAHGSFLSEGVTGLIDLLDERIQEQRSLGPDVPIMSITDLSKGITPPLGRVLMIDDEHQRGWSTVFAALIFGRTDKVYKVAPLPRENSNVQEFLISHWEGGIDQRDAVVRSASELTQDFQEGLFAISEIGMEGDFVKAFLQRRQIGKYQRELVPFDVVLLDYRLHAEGREIPPNEVSGYKLSSLIHHLDPSLPIIVVSASDKVWTLLSMRNVGAWDYYLKPGVSSGNSTDDKYSSQDLKKLIKRLEQTAKYPWARVVSALNEWIQAVQFKLEKDDPARKMFKSSDRSMRAKNWRKRRITASTVLKYIAESLNEYSRLGLMESTDGVVENRPVRYNQYLISVAWESIKYTYRGIDQSDTMRYFDSISRAYRNMIAHDTLPKELPNHIHLLLQIVSLVSLLPELLAWPEVPELHELGFQVSHFSLQDQTRSFLEFISRNANNDQYFNCDSYAKNTPSRDWFKTCGSTRSGQLEGIFKRLKQNYMITTWINLVTPMFAILHTKTYQDVAQGEVTTERISYKRLVSDLFAHAIGAFMR